MAKSQWKGSYISFQMSTFVLLETRANLFKLAKPWPRPPPHISRRFRRTSALTIKCTTIWVSHDTYRDEQAADFNLDRAEERKTRAAPINNLVAISQFREDREEFCLLTRGATKTWFGDYEASQFPVEVLRDYAQTLGDGIGSAQMRAIWEDDAHLLRQHTNGEQWRVSDRQAAPIPVAAGQ